MSEATSGVNLSPYIPHIASLMRATAGYDLGYIDLEQRTLQTIDNPFGTRLSPMS